jgi:hypothetical protein
LSQNMSDDPGTPPAAEAKPIHANHYCDRAAVGQFEFIGLRSILSTRRRVSFHPLGRISRMPAPAALAEGVDLVRREGVDFGEGFGMLAEIVEDPGAQVAGSEDVRMALAAGYGCALQPRS